MVRSFYQFDSQLSSTDSIEESHTPLPPEWENEITLRLREIEDGTVVPVPFDESLRRAYAHINRRSNL